MNNYLIQMGIAAEFLQVANQPNDAEEKAVHQGLLSEDEARACLPNARLALQLLLI